MQGVEDMGGGCGEMGDGRSCRRGVMRCADGVPWGARAEGDGGEEGCEEHEEGGGDGLGGVAHLR
jgi:hypothetical protein